MTNPLILLATAAMDPHEQHAKGTGEIVVTVTNADGYHLPGAVVDVKGSATTRTLITGIKGEVNFPDLPVATYTVIVRMEGFSEAIKRNVAVKADCSIRLRFTLQRDQDS